MTRSSDDNSLPSNVTAELNQFEVDFGKNFRILMPNDQIKGEKVKAHFTTIFSLFFHHQTSL